MHFAHLLVPDAEARGGAADVGRGGAAAAEPRVEADPKLLAAVAAHQLTVGAELLERARVVLDAEVEQLAEVMRRLLAAQAHLLRRDPRRHRAAHLEARARVDVQPEGVEGFEDGRVG